MNKTNIEYLDYTWNPVTGCTKGCPECWARSLAQTRLCKNQQLSPELRRAYETFAPTLHVDRLEVPYSKHGAVVGVCFMGDLFDSTLSLSVVGKVFHSAFSMSKHTYVFLTKHPANLAFKLWQAEHYLNSQSNWYMGVSCRTQSEIDRAHKHLEALHDEGWKVWLSLEPLLERLVIPESLLPCLSAVIVGGMSGKFSAPLHPAWVESLRHSCNEYAIPFFFKQWGEWKPLHKMFVEGGEYLPISPTLVAMDEAGNVVDPDHNLKASYLRDSLWYFERVGTRRAGNLLNGVEYKRLPWELATK